MEDSVGEYEEFIKEKLRTTVHSGFDPGPLHPELFD